MTTFTAVSATEVLVQVWAPEVEPTTLDCRGGVAALLGSVERARAAAARGPAGERDALTRFRAALEPEWSARPALDARCRGDAWAGAALRTADQLRYAEEHAVRYEAGGLAERRERARGLLEELGRAPAAAR
ncbi:MAG: hypothetical protein OZ921_21675 [Sorangiineae bacterium]|nr:hypothetical protein [Polyangiaceae bacterium]MEB2325138.1 hypothetical protein [Sorangiineae bacterium]